MFRTHCDVMRPAARDPQEDLAAEAALLNRVYLCDFCSEGWSSETEVEIHRASVHEEEIAKLMKAKNKSICKICMSSFTDNDMLLRHIKSEHLLSSETAIRVEREIFVCDDCGEIFFNKSLLVYHILKIHMHLKRRVYITCPCCLKSVRLSTSWYHFLRHKLQSVACCKVCCKKFKDRLVLAEHMKCHTFMFKCDLCGYETKKRDLFEVHINQLHKKVETFMEKDGWQKYFIPKSYAHTWARNNLMGWKGVKLNNGVRICVLCREICVGAESMKQHILVDHSSKETPSNDTTCSCGMVFTSKVLYRHHMFKFKKLHEDS